MSLGKTNGNDIPSQSSQTSLNVPHAHTTQSRTSKSAKAAESLPKIDITPLSDLVLPMSIQTRRVSRDHQKQERKIETPSGRFPIEDILPWEFQDYDEEVAQTATVMITQMSESSEQSDPSSPQSPIGEQIMKLPSPDIYSPNNSKAYYILGLTPGALDNPASPFTIQPSKSQQQILLENPPLPIKLVTAPISAQDVKSPISPFKPQFWSKQLAPIDTKSPKKEQSIVAEEFSAASMTNGLIENESEHEKLIKRETTRNRSQSSGRISQVQQRKPFSLTPAKVSSLLTL